MLSAFCLSEEAVVDYGVTSRDYLFRAVNLLEKGDAASLFYAAFELRCGIEARLQQYAEAWNKIPELQRREWAAHKLHKNLERAFGIGEKYMRFGLFHPATKAPLTIHYYTPVTLALRQDAGRLGNYTHAISWKGSDNPYWADTRVYLIEVAKRLCVANMGTLVGPALGARGQLSMTLDLPSAESNAAFPKKVDEKFIIDIRYPDALPNPLEPEAVIWRHDAMLELLNGSSSSESSKLKA